MTTENLNPDSEIVGEPDGDNWLTMARQAYEASTDWFNSSLRKTTEKALAHFANKHAPGSKYHSDSYKSRSRGFRPKTRATIRRNEAAAAVAFFSTQDLVSISAENESDPAQQLSARALSEIVGYRLEDSIPWFQTLIGAYQDTLNAGVCISYQSWDFKEEAEDGTSTILVDKPTISLVALENFRISPAANWVDPIGTSPFVIELISMTIGEIKAKMKAGLWIEADEGSIQKAAEVQYDSVRAAREGSRTNKDDIKYGTTDFDTVFVHRNIIRHEGEDWIFYTLGTEQLLSEPSLLSGAYRYLQRGERPYVMGYSVIEAHKPFPSGLNELTFGLQEEANEISNQRRDNVSLVMNKRYFAKRGANIDFKSLTRNVPGSITMMDDINTDLRWDTPGDVTGSSYQEQDRVSLDYDEIAGTFSPGSVQSNRKIGETVGGMEMLSNDANVITEYQLRVFAASWVEPVLKQLVRMEQAYETDELILAIAGQKAKIQRFGVDQLTDDMLRDSVTVRVNVGFGATNPQQRVQKLTMGLGSIAQFAPQAMAGLEAKEVVIEIMGALGYKNADRFFPSMGEDKQPQQQQQPPYQIAVAQLKAEADAIKTDKVLAQGASIAQMENETAQVRIKVDTDRDVAYVQAETEKNRQDGEMRMAELQVKREIEILRYSTQQQISLEDAKVQLARDSMKLNVQRELAQAAGAMDMQKTYNPPQVATPAFEPSGRAPDGQAFER